MTPQHIRVRLDDDALLELGFAALPVAARRALLRQVVDELALRVGGVVVDAATDEQLDVYERLTADPDDARVWLEEVEPDYAADPALADVVAQADHPDLGICEYAATQWILRTYPELERIVEEQTVVLIAELVAQRDRVVRDLR